MHRVLVLCSVLAIAGLLAACSGDDDDNGGDGAGGGGGGGESVDVLGIWGADELPRFEEMVAPWEDREGSTMNFTGTRDITAILTTRVEGGNPPDIAIPAEIGLFEQFARDGRLVPLSACGLEEQVRADYPETFVDLGTVDGTLYGFFMKADTKGTIWYNPQTFEDNGWEPLGADATFDDLLALTEEIADSDAGIAPWSIGMEAGAGSGFPGSDWIQQIFLNEHGVETYDRLVDGEIPYTDPMVRDAWEKFGQIALGEGFVAQGGAQGINATAFQDSSFLPFEDPPRAAMVALGSFVATFLEEQFPNITPGEDYDFFTWPGGSVTGAANIVYAFNDDEATCSLMRHLASAEAQRIWVEAGGFTSVNRNVDLDAYADDVARDAARQLLEADVFRFDLDDLLGGATQQAIFQGVTQYLANPNNLDQILAQIEASR